RPPGAPRRGAGEARRARADAAGRPGTARAAGRGAGGGRGRLRRAAARSLRREGGPRGPPADSPQGGKPPEGGRVPSARRGRGGRVRPLHGAKGLEGEAVFLPGVEEGELPVRRGDVEEERRLFYVGLTRARRHLLVTWEGKPSRFLDELGVRAASPPAPKRERQALEQTPAVQALREWRGPPARAPPGAPDPACHTP